MIAVGLLVASLAASAPGTGPDVELADLGFLAGCWEGEFQSRGRKGKVEEFYTRPSRNVILGATRFILDGMTVDFEFSYLFADSSGIVLLPYPNGRPSEHRFRLTRLDGESAVFESPEHDYPKRILYWTEEDGTRVARIDGGADDKEGREWRFHRVACP